MHIQPLHPSLILASSFYTEALEKPFAQVLPNTDGAQTAVTCVPYNQLYSFLLNPLSLVAEGTSAKVLLLLRVEDLIRFELMEHGKDAGSPEVSLDTFHERVDQFLEILGLATQRRLTFMICPSGRGAHSLAFFGNAIRVAEHKILATLRRQQRHTIYDWSEMEKAAPAVKWFNPAGDRLGHVPFTPEGLNALAGFFASQIERLPVERFEPISDATAKLNLEHFLDELNVEMSLERLKPGDEQQIISLLQRTTHFVNLPDQKWNVERLRELVANTVAAEDWVVRVRDRFGDYGISGTVTFAISQRVMQVGLLFLTCVILGKEVEYALLAWMAHLAYLHEADFIEVPFAPGRDNHALAGLLARIAEDELTEGDRRCFRLRVEGLTSRISGEAQIQSAVVDILSKLQVGVAV